MEKIVLALILLVCGCAYGTATETDGDGGGVVETTSTSTVTYSDITVAGPAKPPECFPPSAYGENCAYDSCGSIKDYYHGAPVCDRTCEDTATYKVINSEYKSETTWLFDDFGEDPKCMIDGCAWSFVVTVYDAGCVRATVSDGLHVDLEYEESICGQPSQQTCAIAMATNADKPTKLRVIATAEANVKVGWLRVETAGLLCSETDFEC